MPQTSRCALWICCFLLFAQASASGPAAAQNAARTKLSKINFEGLKSLPADLLIAESGLKIGDLAGREDLQAAADRLALLGLFSKINYEYRSQMDGLTVTFHAEEAPRVPVYFDNIPWFADSELADAIKKNVPFYDGTCPEGGAVLERIANAVRQLLQSHQLNVSVEHEYIGNPISDGMVQEFHITGASLKIARIEFADPLANSSRGLQIHVSELLGKPYSRMTIDLFLAERVRPVYLQKGYLRAKIGPPEIRLTADPTKPLPDTLPVFVPISPGAVFHWQGAQWSGNAAMTAGQLNEALALKSGDVADGLAIQAALDRVQEEYGRRGYLEAKLEPQAVYDDQAHTVSYGVSVNEGVQYRCGELVITGASLAAEKRIRAAWPIPGGGILDKLKYEQFLSRLQIHKEEIFGDLPVHYDEVGHWLRTDAQRKIADVLFDFK
jgi:outer membrane protein assembly factor BamA